MYAYDERSVACEELESWLVARQVVSKCNYLGIQDASRKRKAPSREAGAWQVSVVWSENNCTRMSVTPPRWDKCKEIIQWLREQVAESPEKICHHPLE